MRQWQIFPGRGVANTSLGGPVYKNLLQTMQIIEMHSTITEEKNGVNVWLGNGKNFKHFK